MHQTAIVRWQGGAACSARPRHYHVIHAVRAALGLRRLWHLLALGHLRVVEAARGQKRRRLSEDAAAVAAAHTTGAEGTRGR